MDAEQRLEFDDDGGLFGGFEGEIHEAGTDAHLGNGGDAENIADQSAENTLGGGFGLGAALELVEVGVERRVGGLEARVRQERGDLDFGEAHQAAEFREDFVGVQLGHRLREDCQASAAFFKGRTAGQRR